MNTNMTGFRWLSKNVMSRALDESGLSKGRVKVEEHTPPLSFKSLHSVKNMQRQGLPDFLRRQ